MHRIMDYDRLVEDVKWDSPLQKVSDDIKPWSYLAKENGQ